MKSPVVKRSIVIAGHKTSVSLEDAFWKGLKEIAGGRDMTLSDLVATIDTERQHGNLSSAIRLFVLDYYRSQLVRRRTGATERTRSWPRARPRRRPGRSHFGGQPVPLCGKCSPAPQLPTISHVQERVGLAAAAAAAWLAAPCCGCRRSGLAPAARAAPGRCRPHVDRRRQGRGPAPPTALPASVSARPAPSARSAPPDAAGAIPARSPQRSARPARPRACSEPAARSDRHALDWRTLGRHDLTRAVWVGAVGWQPPAGARAPAPARGLRARRASSTAARPRAARASSTAPRRRSCAWAHRSVPSARSRFPAGCSPGRRRPPLRASVSRASSAPSARLTLPPAARSAPWARTIMLLRRACPALIVSAPSASATVRTPLASAASIRSRTGRVDRQALIDRADHGVERRRIEPHQLARSRA